MPSAIIIEVELGQGEVEALRDVAADRLDYLNGQHKASESAHEANKRSALEALLKELESHVGK